MECRLLEVWVTINNKKEAEEIAHDIEKILDDYGITNNVKVTDETC